MDPDTETITPVNGEGSRHRSARNPSSASNSVPFDWAPLLQQAKERTLNFFGNASNETLGACLVGLGAATYIVLGRVGLVLIGVVGGVALHASWDSSHAQVDGATKKKLKLDRQKETGIEVALRVLEWRQKRDEDVKDLEVAQSKPPEPSTDYSSFRPETAEALETLTNAVVRDYIKWWYSPIIPADSSFPTACQQTLTKLVVLFSSNLARKRPADALLNFVTNSTSIFIVFLNELSAALSASPNLPAIEAIPAYLESKPQSSLTNLLDGEQQQKKLHMVAEDVLERYLDSSVWRCHPARFFLREILANVILEKTVQSCSRSEWINDWIIYALEEGEPEIMNVIDDSIESATVEEVAQKPESYEITEDGIVISQHDEAGKEKQPESEKSNNLTVEEDSWRRNRQSSDDDTSDDNSRGIQTPSSSHDGVIAETSIPSSSSNFPKFDQMPTTPIAKNLPTSTHDVRGEAVSIHRAAISIFDDSDPLDKRPWKNKPTCDYLIQVEPRSARSPGWMIMRTYENFESLHEVLRRISVISGVAFTATHSTLPSWRGMSKEQLRAELEKYLVDAVSYEALAETEGMWRFVDKDRSMAVLSPSSNKPGFWPSTNALENVGKGVLGTLSKAPKGIAGGGRAVIGGVTNVLGAGNSLNDGKKATASPSPLGRQSIVNSPKESMEALRNSIPSTPLSQNARNSSLDFVLDDSVSSTDSEDRAPIRDAYPRRPSMRLPPAPIDISDDYVDDDYRSPGPGSPRSESSEHEMETTHMSIDGLSLDIPTYSPRTVSPLPTPSAFPGTPTYPPSSPLPTMRQFPATAVAPQSSQPTALPPPQPPRPTAAPSRTHAPLTEQETQMTVELLFASITSLYTLSSAWQFRLTLLTAAKSFLLRPGNPQLTSIRTMMQSSLLDANTTDAGIAALIQKVRANGLPTEEELKAWLPPLGEKERDERRKRARRLLVERGMPQALTSVMGAAASGEALGKVFDCLQVERVARGLVFGLVLQALRAAVQ